MKLINTQKSFTVVLMGLMILSSCETEEIQPIDIFEEENVEELISNGQVTDVPLDNICAGNSLFVNNERINPNLLGYTIKGTIFSDSDLGPIAVTNGEFDLIRDNNGTITSFQGYGTAQFPKAGFLNDALVMADLYGAQTRYGSGSLFNQEEAEGGFQLPFSDNSCFFQFTLDPYPEFGSDEAGGLAMIKNALFDYDILYYDPSDPAIFFDGKMHEYDVKEKPKPSAQGNEPKRFKSKKDQVKATISDVRFGISLNERFPFTPLTFSEELEERVGGTNFMSFNGGLYMSGKVTLKKYPLFVIGETVISSPSSIVDVFDLGFGEALYTRGINGQVFFGHDLINLLPFDLEIELGRATLQENIEPGNTFLRFAGEYDMDTRDFFERVIGPDATRFLPSVSRSGQMYVNIGEDIAEWEYYMMQEYSLDIPGLTSSMKKQYFHFTPQKVELGGEMQLPFGLGGVEVLGELEDDGSFLLYGTINGNIPFGEGVSLNGELTLEVSNEGAFLYGEVNLPGSVAGISVRGEITDQGIVLEGEGDVDIRFADGATLAANLHILASTQEGVFIDGFLQTPLQVAAVAVTGELSARGLLLSGTIDGLIDFGVTRLSSNLTLHASTWDGAMLSGFIDVPLVIIGGNITVSGEILTDQLFSLSGSTNAYLDFGVIGTNAGISFGFAPTNISIASTIEFCTDLGCVDVGLSFNPDWGRGTVQICGTFVTEVCIP